jgi:hypothetical protein
MIECGIEAFWSERGIHFSAAFRIGKFFHLSYLNTRIP